MTPILRALLAFAVSLVRSRVSLQLEILALQHQLAVYRRSIRRPHVRPSDRLFWSGLARGWARWPEVLVFVQPATALAWQRKCFHDHWARLSRREPGRPAISKEVRELIREISGANPRWGSPAFLENCGSGGFRWRNPRSRSIACTRDDHPVLFVLIVLAHERRRILQFNVTEHPTGQWTAQQLLEAFPRDTGPTYLLRDRDAVYGECFQRRVTSLGIDQILAALRSPCQNAYAKRVIGSIRWECLNHVMVFSEGHLWRLLASYFHCYHRWRTHLSLAMDCPDARPVQPPEQGAAVAFPEVGGLHHHYDRLAA